MADWWVESFRDVSLTVPPMLGFSADLPSQLAGSTLTVPRSCPSPRPCITERAVSLTIPWRWRWPEQHTAVLAFWCHRQWGVAAAQIHGPHRHPVGAPDHVESR